MITLIDKERKDILEKIFQQLNERGYNIIVIYHPLNREETIRIILYNNILKPVGNAVIDYSIEGRDITSLLKNQSVSVQEGGIISDAVEVQIENLKVKKYKFSSDYSFEEYL